MNIKIEAKRRETKKKSDLTEMRNAEIIPAIIYKSGEEGLNISISEADFAKEYRKSIGEIAYFLINVDGKEHKTIIKEKQVHPVSRRIQHIDFLELVDGNKLTLKIPLKYSGEPVGLKEGGKLEILVREIKIKCLPKDIPENVKIDLTPLGVGQSIHFSNITLENVYSKLPGNTVLAQVKGAKK
ncbi:MAG: 50S ribosomal protein L25 [Candidatus Cloacimonetes bacterium]|nr:50S ribosomal protein L25 [Candidatus Cloacimonadota bacterium]